MLKNSIKIKKERQLKSALSAFAVLVLCFALIAPQVIAIAPLQTRSSEVKGVIHDRFEDDWYYLPPFPNYAPSGMPDFSQKQDDWTDREGNWLVCAAVALADVFWWLDSKHADQNGTPGDGNDAFPLVRDYNAPGTPNPGPYSDDHNFNNVNDNLTPWKIDRRSGEFIEKLAWCIYGDMVRFRFFRTGPLLGGLIRGFRIVWCVEKWIRDAGLQDYLKAKFIFRPSFSMINERLRNDEAIVLAVFGAGYNPEFKPLPLQWGHCVALAGINSTSYIAISDPWADVMNPSSDPTEHNNASIVSHDIYQVNFTSPYPRLASWWLPEYFNGALTIGAIIISETH